MYGCMDICCSFTQTLLNSKNLNNRYCLSLLSKMFVSQMEQFKLKSEVYCHPCSAYRQWIEHKTRTCKQNESSVNCGNRTTRNIFQQKIVLIYHQLIIIGTISYFKLFQSSAIGKLRERLCLRLDLFKSVETPPYIII